MYILEYLEYLFIICVGFGGFIFTGYIVQAIFYNKVLNRYLNKFFRKSAFRDDLTLIVIIIIIIAWVYLVVRLAAWVWPYNWFNTVEKFNTIV
tara:strand:+ start:703 stop:981 length:279 start_codon:yes stop_codon:yes gene_type:complete